MNILDEIVANTRAKVSIAKEKFSLDDMISTIHSTKIVKSKFKASLKDKDQAIIAEIKKASPSAGVISEDFDPVTKAREYKAFGASALSILTEEDYFLGSIQFLKDVKEVSDLPILRKDFIVDIYQIYESKLIGSDCILLIASILSDTELEEFTQLSDSLGLDYIIEVHNEEELRRAQNFSKAMIGVNNRNLKTFNVDIENSIRLKKLFKENNLFIAESGIKGQEDIDKLIENDINIFLIGESLMKGDFV
jgi:indole-3-glycerol phosphate synthase